MAGDYTLSRSRCASVLRLSWTEVPSAPADLLKPKLYALGIGVSDYVDENFRLGFAAKDAKDFAGKLQILKGGMYADIVVRLATDREVTRSSVVVRPAGCPMRASSSLDHQARRRRPELALCHEYRRSTRRCATVREMKEGPSRSAIRCW
jgi:hypothetical protein